MVTPNAAPCLFLSHSGADTDAARELKRRLLDSPDARAARPTIWLDKDDLGAGIGWQAQVEKAIIEKTTAFAVHIGAKGVVNWVDSEVRLALSRATGTAGYPFIPILSRECADAASLPPFAQQYQGVHDPLNNPEEFAKLLGAVLGRSPNEKAVALESARQSRFSYSGTGFLVGEDLVITNRHVLQTFAVQGTDGNWSLYQDATIDFIGEIDNPATLSFRITKVVFAGPEPILGLDPKRLDLALVAIEPISAGTMVPAPVVLSSKSGTVSSRRDLYVVGFPAAADLFYGSGDPAVGTEFANVLSSLFRDEFGVKRLAPGQIDAGIGTVDDGGKQWAFEHDASTLGGNSGSMVTDFGDGSTVIGLHFGGGPRRENYAHALAMLKSELARFGVNCAE
jgi:hypothetical protein